VAAADESIHDQISRLVQREHALRERLADTVPEDERAAGREELKELEVALDVCWDLLRQRDARRTAGEDPDAAAPRSSSEVEGYLQ
jgi:hypothetical protein